MSDTNYKVNSGFFDSVNDDRLYTADDMNRPYRRVITNGVFATPHGTPSDDLQVFTANSGMNIIVKKGDAIIGDKWFENPADLTITVDANNDIVPRIDTIVAQINTLQNGRVGNIVYRSGSASSNPQPPEINQVTGIIEMRLANILVARSTSSITQDVITDLRGSSECPWITSLIQQVDTSTLYEQWNAAYQKYYDDETASFNAFMESLTTQLTVNTNLMKYESHYFTPENNTTVIPINVSVFDKDKDVLLVNINGLLASEITDYSISSDSSSITLTKSLPANQNVDFIVLQSVVVGDTATVMQAVETLQETLNRVRVVAPNGQVKMSVTDTSSNVLNAFTGMGVGFHTVHCGYGVQGAPTASEYAMFGEVTATGYGWIFAIRNDGSTYVNYLVNAAWRGWRCLYENTPAPLYQSTNGIFPNNDVAITPTKKLSQCQHGWELIFTGYDDASSTGRDQYTQTVHIPKRSYKAANWNGETTTFQLVYGYTQASSVIQSCIKSFQIYDDRIVSTIFNSQGTSRNIALRAIYEY